MSFKVPANYGGDTSIRRRLGALLIDAAICFVGVQLFAHAWFTGLPAILLVLGVYKFVSDVAFGRTLGQSLTVLYVVLQPLRRRRPAWWLLREGRFWVGPGLFTLIEIPVAHTSLGTGVGIILFVAVPLMLTETGVLIADLVHALNSPDGRSLSDLISHTAVRTRRRGTAERIDRRTQAS